MFTIWSYAVQQRLTQEYNFTNKSSIGCSDNIEQKWLCLAKYYILDE